MSFHQTVAQTLLVLLGTSFADKLIFEDTFDEFNLKTWNHEIDSTGGGNGEFQTYHNSRHNSFVDDGKLYIQPTFTGTSMDGKEQKPVQSAKITTVDSFNFTYGKVEVVAQLPKGDWLWPAIWLMPKDAVYGGWPISGDIDIVESYGNDPSCKQQGNNYFSTKMHWGLSYLDDGYKKTEVWYTHPTTLADEMHTFGLVWTKERMFTYLDDESNILLDVDTTEETFFERGGFKGENPWKDGGYNAPFDQDYYLIINVAVGATNGYWKDGECGKPWSDSDRDAENVFYDSYDQWYPSWNYPETQDAALKVDSVRVWELTGEEAFLQ